MAAGAGWLGVILIIDAVVSPSGTGIVYIGTSARLSYALGEMPELPGKLAETDRRGVPIWSILLSAVIGVICFGPFKSWASLVGAVTGATAIMYGFAPVALGALRKHDGDRERSYRMPMPALLLPLGFISANLILYWGGYVYMWKIDIAIVVGLIAYFIGASMKNTLSPSILRHGLWVLPWLLGSTVIGYFGEYKGVHPVYDNWWFGQYSDLVVVIVFSLVVYYYAVSTAMPRDMVQEAVARDSRYIDSGKVLNVPMS